MQAHDDEHITVNSLLNRWPIMSAQSDTILLIDDDDNSHTILNYYLRHAGFKVCSAKSIFSAFVALYSDQEWVAVLIDIHLSGYEAGWALLEELNQMRHQLLAKTRLIVYSVEDTRLRAKTLGADAALIKPVDREQLVSLLQSYSQYRN